MDYMANPNDLGFYTAIFCFDCHDPHFQGYEDLSTHQLATLVPLALFHRTGAEHYFDPWDATPLARV